MAINLRSAATIVLIAGLTVPSLARRHHDEERAVEPAATDTARAVAAPVLPPAAPATVLDTLNAGREARLTPADLPARDGAAVPPATAPVAAPAQPASSTLPPAPAAKGGGRELYRIQCVAATQSSTLEAGRKSLETRVAYPARIIHVPPYYKLYVGEFTTRADAEKALFEVKGAGYPGAWIVKDTLNAAGER
jgi:septal ring-binding cell division protein DamX